MRHFDGRDYIYVLAIEIAIIVMTVVPLAIANSISYKNDYEKRNELANLKLQAQRADIIRMDKEYQDIRKIRHDMVKHLNIYMHLLNDGDYEGLRQAIGEHIEDVGQNKYCRLYTSVASAAGKGRKTDLRCLYGGRKAVSG